MNNTAFNFVIQANVQFQNLIYIASLETKSPYIPLIHMKNDIKTFCHRSLKGKAARIKFKANRKTV
jgi:hypothetical protein